MVSRLRVEVPSDAEDRPAVLAAAAAFVRARGVDDHGVRRVTEVLAALLAWAAARAFPDGSVGPVTAQLQPVEGGLDVLISDRGHPAPDFGGVIAPIPDALSSVQSHVRELRQVNLAELGTRLSAVIAIPGLRPSAPDLAAPARSHPVRVTPGEVEIRDGTPGDAAAIVDLLFAAYGLSYAHPDFYRPEWIVRQLTTGRVLSTVAEFHGEVVAHHALLVTEPSAALESAVVVVHPAFRSLGIVSNHLDHVRAQAVGAGAPAILSRAVTHHPYTQLIEQSLGFRTTGLMLGASAYEDHPRSALTLAYLVLDDRAHAVAVPSAYAGPVTAAFDQAGVQLDEVRGDVAPADPSPAVTTTRSRLDVLPGTEMITVSAWDDRTRAKLGRALSSAVKADVAAAYLDVDLEVLTVEQVDDVVGMLRGHDCFYCGVVLFGHRGHHHLRLQRMLTDNVQVRDLALEGDDTARLFDQILADAAGRLRLP